MQNILLIKNIAGAALALCLYSASFTLADGASDSAVPSRVLQSIDDNDTVVLAGNTHPPGRDEGLVDADHQMHHMSLLLKRSAEQERALAAFNQRQYDPNSSDYHHWLHAAEFAALYGPSDADIAAVTQWLRSHGFQIQQVSAGKISIEFSASVAQVERAFGVQMHRYLIDGAQHIANDRDPTIPRALSPVVMGIASLNDFRSVSQMIRGRYVRRDIASGRITEINTEIKEEGSASEKLSAGAVDPQFVYTGPLQTTVEDLAPYDFATIYNLLPLWTSAAPIEGTGVTVAIAGQSDIALGDIATYRKSFGLPAKLPSVVHNGADPGLTRDQSEQTLDVEMVSAAAPAADITLVVTSSTTANGVIGSAQYIVDHEIAPIMSMSYGLCELFAGQAGNALRNSIWQQGATEGISIFVSSADSGSAECTPGNPQASTTDAYGLQVNADASSPYVTAVGGTDFLWNWYVNGATTYWNTQNASNGATAKGYIPEMAWNTVCTNPLLQQYGFVSGDPSEPIYPTSEALCNGILKTEYSGFDFALLENVAGSGGGESHCTTPTGATCAGGYAKPTWQTGTGVPADGKRDVPDVSLFSANWINGPLNWGGSAILICDSSGSPTHSCDYSPTYITYQEDGGTSAAAPFMAGVMALVVQKMGRTLQGLANPTLYKLATTDDLSSCNSSSLPVTRGSNCIFHDITVGSNAQPCITGDTNCITSKKGDAIGTLSGYAATTGYDRTTGLGSINADNLVRAWASAAPAPEVVVSTTSLTFASTVIGSASATQVVTAKNTGSVAATLTVGGITLSGADASSFSDKTTCGASLSLGASCTITVTFKPAAAGRLTALLSIADNATGAPQKVSLNGAGLPISVSPTSISFPNTVTAATSGEQLVTLKNLGTSAVTISSIALVGANPSSFVELSSCGASLAAAATCAIYVAFAPSRAAALSATLNVTDSALGSPQTVALRGIGTAVPSVKLSSASLAFPATAHGTTSAAQAVTVMNSGAATLDLASITLTGTNPTDFEALNNCGPTLAPNAACTVFVAFKPAAAGVFKANLRVADSGASSPQVVALSGTGK